MKRNSWTAPCPRISLSSTGQSTSTNIARAEQHPTFQRSVNSASSSSGSVRFSPESPFQVYKTTSKQSCLDVFRSKQSRALHKRTKSAPPVTTQKYSSDVLGIRGKYYDSSKTIDTMYYLRAQSIPRRIQRLISEPSKTVKETELTNGRSLEEISSIDVVTLLETRLNNKQLLERRRGLHLRRSINKLEARAKIGYTFYRVLLAFRVKLIMTRISVDLSPVTSTQISWNKIRHPREAGEVLFSKSYYQKRSSIYSYVPKWAEIILRKAPVERTDREVMQIHAMMHGLVAYDKFTRRVQIAMCRSMKYFTIEYPRIILRKGHVGLAFYMIFSGSVFINIEELHMETNKVVHRTFSTLHRGDAFGEVALLRNIRRTASVAVREEVEVMVVDKSVFAQVCSEIYEKEMAEKIEFCRQLPLFKNWRDDAIKHICQDSQIHEYRSNKIIVRNKADEEEWIYICMKGECRVIKGLEFDKKPERSANLVSQYLQEEQYSSGLNPWIESADGDSYSYRRTRFFPTHLEIINELQISLEQTDLRKIAKNQILDDENATKSRNNQEKRTIIKKMGEAEEILNSIGKKYNYLPHCTGETKYCVVNKDKKQLEFLKSKIDQLEDHDLVKGAEQRRKSIDITAFLNEELVAGRLNTKIVYLNIASMKKGDVYNLREVLEPTGRQLILVSVAAKILQIKKQSFFRSATKKSILTARALALENNYPDDDVLYYQFRKKCLWDVLKTQVLQQTMANINVTHVSRDQQPSKMKFTAKERATSARKIFLQLKT